MTELTAAELADLLAEHLRQWPPLPQESLLCAPDVMLRLRNHIMDVVDDLRWPQNPLINIGIIVTPDSAPGTWRIIRHDACRVDAEKGQVYHSECSIPAEGVLISDRSD